MPKEKIQEKAKVHTVYKKLDGTRVPGVTTVLGVLNKPALVGWAWGLGDRGISLDGYRDDLAGVGKLVHAMILRHYAPERTFDEKEYSPNDHDRAANSFLSFLEWEKRHLVEPFMLEMPMIDEVNDMGGTPDFIGDVDGIPTLMDFKSGSGIYKEAHYQAAAYRHLTNHGFLLSDENRMIPLGYKTERAIILNIGRAENEDFTEVIINRPQPLEWQIVLACRSIYRLEKELKKA
jgi:hypothetical protein